MKLYTAAEKRRARVRAMRKKAETVVLTDPIAPCDEKMKETAAEVAEELDAGLNQD